MGKYFKEFTLTVWKKGEVNFYGKMVQNMSGTSKIIICKVVYILEIFKVMESFNGQIEKHIRDNGLIIKCMVKEKWNGLMGLSSKVYR